MKGFWSFFSLRAPLTRLTLSIVFITTVAYLLFSSNVFTISFESKSLLHSKDTPPETKNKQPETMHVPKNDKRAETNNKPAPIKHEKFNNFKSSKHVESKNKEIITEQPNKTIKFIESSNQNTPIKTTSPSPSHYASVMFEGRLGNQLFEFASLYGIAKKNNLIPVISPSCILRKIFKISVKTTNDIPNIKFSKKYNEKKGCTFEPDLMAMGGKENLWIHGYLQSWKYFTDVEEDIRKELTFQDHIQNKAKSIFLSVTSTKKDRYKRRVTYIAVHVRRGDMLSRKDYVQYGYTVASLEYIQKAMNRFRDDFSNCLFVVASDDIPWCKSNLKDEDVVFVPPGNPPELDVAVLTKCNHTIVTVGSYGWWTAFLINGQTIYYKGYPTPGSNLAALLNPSDYRFPQWIGM